MPARGARSGGLSDSHRGFRDRIELLDGLLVDKLTTGPRPCAARGLPREALGTALPDGWFARQGDPITLPDGPLESCSPIEALAEPFPGLLRSGTKAPAVLDPPGAVTTVSL
jgi:hypothetical protein